MKKALLCTAILSLFLAGCGSTDSVMEDIDGEESSAEIDSEETEFSISTSVGEPSLETYSDSYVSFTYDPDLFSYEISESDTFTTIFINCSSMPEAEDDVNYTFLAINTQDNPDYAIVNSEYEIQLGLSVLSKTICQGVFPLEENESIVDEHLTYSDCTSEYYMEISDGSKCYTKSLNYNDHITTIAMRLCEYSAEYNDSIMDIYNSAKSEYGNYDLSSAADSELIADPPAPTAEPEPSTEPAAIAETESTTEPEPAAESVPDPASTPTATAGQKNALKKAKQYLDYSAFSYNGLINQLEYEGYTNEEATYAVDNCGADWNDQSLQKAKQYLEYSAFSYNGLINQLEYEKFTSEQATYGANNCGADWNEQAAKKAKQYLDYSSFSRDQLIDQLEYEGFTHDQAVYGAQANGY